MYEDDAEGRSRTGLIAAAVVGVAAVAFVGFRVLASDNTPKAFTVATAPVSAPASDDPFVPESAVSSSNQVTTTGSATADTQASPAMAATAASRDASSTAPTEPSATAAPAAPSAATHPTLPDGSPQPVLAVFDVDKVILSGYVPSQEASDRLAALALGNARDPSNTTVQNFLLIDPTVPIDVGVRVVELTSQRFPEGSAEVVGSHGLELDRVANVMKALPNVTVLVIGHADQRGDDLVNYKLSADRATAVVNYLVGDGVQANRLSSRAVGEADLLTLDSDETALALNRRTEFVFYGLLVQ